MKNIKAVLLSLSLVVAASCNKNHDHAHSSDGDDEMSHSATEHAHHESMPHDEPTDMSLYHLTSTWTTQDGETIRLKDLQGKIQLMAMVYTTCQYACPRIVADLRSIQSQLEQKKIEDKVHFVLVSIDPKVDTVVRLKAFANENNMSNDEWSLLHGQEGDILELAALLGVKYKKTSASDYAHSNIITVLDQQGEIAHQQTGLGSDASRTIQVIEGLIR